MATVAVGATVAVVSLAVYITVRGQLLHSLDDSLVHRAKAAARTSFPQTVANLPPSLFLASDVKLAVIQNDAVSSAPNGRAALPYISAAELDVAHGQSKQSIRTVAMNGIDYRVVAVPYGPSGALVLAQSLDPTGRVLSRLGLVLWVIGLAGVLVSGVSGWAVASNGLRPVRRLTAAAEHVARTEELTPIEVTGDDELARLTVAFNTMLMSLSASQQRQRQLVADAGHELRTPLTSLRTNLELLAQADTRGGLAPASRAELLRDVGAQIEELSTLVGDLVELARDEDLPHRSEPTDLAEVVETSVERVRRRSASIEFEVDTESWMVVGEPQLLERAITNLLDNAAKWSPPLGTVTVRLRDGVLTVTDHGPGISATDLPHIFERFYRSQEARTLPGSGLGLSIVAQTAARHGGTVSAGGAPGRGAVLTLRLPGQPASA
ncbi:MAG: sensor histidine kinase [Nocardioidaceae bacterium]